MLRCIATFSHLQWAQSADCEVRKTSQKSDLYYFLCNTVLQLPSCQLAALTLKETRTIFEIV